ncbi:MAG: DNA mismatch repair endonuclease MutL [Breznakia sp.]
MTKIARLDPHLTNMIAAGEVVERPTGVIKELVENAIDAKASKIEVHIHQGGMESMMVIDNGEGMSQADASLAFERHATSKIKTMQDLWRISTMGFRGEALPSIASVSHVELQSNDGVQGTKIEIVYGKIICAQPIGTAKGTQIMVRNLFQKTPARFKHLKSPQYESSLINDVMQKFAFAYPGISFTLINDGKMTFQTSGKGNMQEVMMQVYGREVAKEAMAIDASDHDYKLHGYAAQPTFTRATKYYMLLYINKRMVRSYRLQKAIQDAYAPYIPSDRNPIVILHIDMDPQLVDVNVHPSKWEIRLSKEKQLETLIYESISKALKIKMQVPKVVRETPKANVMTPVFDFQYDTTLDPVSLHKEVNESFVSYHQEAVKQEVSPQKNSDIPKGIQQVDPSGDEKLGESSSIAKNASFPVMQVLAQLHKCYILAQGDNGMYIIDQHAAQERYHYEEIKKMLLSGVKEQQPLLLPLSIDVSRQAVAQIEEMNALFSQIGMQLEVFGEHEFVVRSLPIWMSEVVEEKFLQDMIDFFLKNREVNIENLRKKALATMACHSSIRFNRHLSFEEMEKVVEDLRHCEQPFHCPHGRPTFIELTLKELEKDLLRVK